MSGTVLPIFRLALGQVRLALEEEDALDDGAGMLALVVGFVNALLGQLVEAHVGVHLAVDQVLVDGGQLAGQQGIEDVDDFLVALHGFSPEVQLRSGLAGSLGWLAQAGIVGRLVQGLNGHMAKSSLITVNYERFSLPGRANCPCMTMRAANQIASRLAPTAT
jgi:hypothetical protein